MLQIRTSHIFASVSIPSPSSWRRITRSSNTTRWSQVAEVILIWDRCSGWRMPASSAVAIILTSLVCQWRGMPRIMCLRSIRLISVCSLRCLGQVLVPTSFRVIWVDSRGLSMRIWWLIRFIRRNRTFIISRRILAWSWTFWCGWVVNVYRLR